MRILPRFTIPKLKSLRRKWRRWQQHLSVARVTLGIELLVLTGALLFILSGNRVVFLDRMGSRVDMIVLVSLFLALVVLHQLFKRYFLQRIEHYFSPAPYDERRILFDLSQAYGRQHQQLYESIAGRIAHSFEAADVSILCAMN